MYITRRGASCLLLLLIPVLSSSQTTYPKVLVPGDKVRDTIVAITIGQADAINDSLYWNEQLRIINDTLYRRVDSCRIAFKLFHQSDSVMRAELNLKISAITERDALISQQHSAITQRDRQIVKLKRHKVLIGAGGIILAVVTLLLLH